ncbi:hypothetical protein RI367_007624 [Sorochytrium milnesiophthora]
MLGAGRSKRITVNSLPDELLIHALAHLEPDNLGTCAAVCRRWGRIVTDDRCWREALFKFFGVRHVPVARIQDTWRYEYMHRCVILRAFHRSGGHNVLFDSRITGVAVENINIAELLDPASGVGFEGGLLDACFVDWEAGKMLVGSPHRGSVVQCDYQTGRVSRDIIYCGPRNEPEHYACIAVEGHRIASAHPTGQLFVVSNFKSNGFMRHVKALALTVSGDGVPLWHPHAQHDGPVSLLQWVHNTAHLVSVGSRDVTLQAPAMAVLSSNGQVQLDPTLQRVSGRVKVWNTAAYKQEQTSCCVAILSGNEEPVLALATTHRHYTLTLSSTRLNVYPIDYSQLPNLVSASTPAPIVSHPVRTLATDSLGATHLYYTRDTHPLCLLWSTQEQATCDIHVVDLDTGYRLARLRGHSAHVTRSAVLSISRSAAAVSTSSANDADSKTASAASSLSSSLHYPAAVDRLPSFLLVSGDADGALLLWHVGPRHFTHLSASSAHTVTLDPSLRMSPSSSLASTAPVLAAVTALHVDPVKIVSGASDGWIRVWDVISGRCIKKHLCIPTRKHDTDAAPEVTAARDRMRAVVSVSATTYRIVAAMRSGQVKSLDFSTTTTDNFASRSLRKHARGRQSTATQDAQGNPSANAASRRSGNAFRETPIEHEIRLAKRALQDEAKEQKKWSRTSIRANGTAELTEDELVQMAMQMSLDASFPDYSSSFTPTASHSAAELEDLDLAIALSLQESLNGDDEKDTTPFGKLPVLIFEENGKEVQMAQSMAISRYIAAKHGIAPTDPLQRALSESVAETVDDLKRKVLDVFMAKGDAKEKAQKELYETVAPAVTKYLTRMLQQNGSTGIFVGDKIGVPELALYYWLKLCAANYPEAFTRASAPELYKVYDTVEQNERIKAYLASTKHIEKLLP